MTVKEALAANGEDFVLLELALALFVVPLDLNACGSRILTSGGGTVLVMLEPSEQELTSVDDIADGASEDAAGVEHKNDVFDNDLGRSLTFLLEGRPLRRDVAFSLGVEVHSVGLWAYC